MDEQHFLVAAPIAKAAIMAGIACVAHISMFDFHYVSSLGALFQICADQYHCFLKITGYVYSEAPRKLHFWLTFISANLAFFPMHFLELLRMPRRIASYPDAFAGMNESSSIAAQISAVGLIVFSQVWPCLCSQGEGLATTHGKQARRSLE